ncbi:MAG TPA: polymer-forming cytoskeletal protein [Leptospiraceae bacterium]|nr:polymer-forming cytoskeletal protein [Leptospiraceae bacterium]HMZ61813.1 polymer-forming cytoskeletal protein [Leptospiraceae bacterium]HNF16891.1 polymer-forming cytoskeletal protein [Leptospiraceae bacterium]HNF24719.1 polymer-forming cytoskeletal protein [Leptospiraceae bacterium]HNI97350.1 polymer-forming cytoskeletal protein [Leptospiraceae bacterium]
MQEKENFEEFIVNSIIGEGSEFSGEFRVNGLVRIDGKFRGLIDTEGKVLIGKTGIIDTDIKARIVVAGGQVNGNIYASEKVILLATCRLYGDIIAPVLVIEEGVVFQGKCTITPRP